MVLWKIQVSDATKYDEGTWLKENTVEKFVMSDLFHRRP